MDLSNTYTYYIKFNTKILSHIEGQFVYNKLYIIDIHVIYKYMFYSISSHLHGLTKTYNVHFLVKNYYTLHFI